VFCTVLENPERFVALGAGPSPRARLIARMQLGDEVQALEGSHHGWQEVYRWHGLGQLDRARRG
jgi:hypothetical protein